MKKQGWFGNLLGFARHQKLKFVISILFSVISITSGLVPFYCAYRIVEEIYRDCLSLSSGLYWCGVSLVFYIIKVVFFGLSTGISHHMAFNVVAGLRSAVVNRFLHAPLGDVEKYSIGKIKNVIVDKTDNIESPLAHVVPEGAGHIALPMLSLIALCLINWKLALASLVTLPVGLLCIGLTFKISGRSFQEYSESNAYMNSTIVEYMEGIEVIKAFGKAGTSYEKYSSAIKNYKTFVLKWMSSTWVTMKLALSVMPSTLIGTLPMGLYLAANDVISPASVAFACMISMCMVSSLSRLETFSESLRQMKETVESLNEFLSIEPLDKNSQSGEFNDNNTDIFTDSECTPKDFNIEMKNVHFGYSDDLEIIHGINLTLPQGSYTALVGPSGGGKSTIAKLLARFWDVSQGEISIGGVNIKNMPIEKLSDYVSFVTQDNFLFNCSLLENIRMGNPSATDEEVKTAAKAAQCEEFISKLPMGYNTPAGEAGRRLSGGEKQRIAIARMMLKNAPIVILDEATAFTDPENEDKIQNSIAELTKGKTLLVIAHRLSTIKNADNIIVLEKGNILAQGKQEELLKSCPLYNDMWQAHIGSKIWAVSTSKTSKNTIQGGNK